jgi:hypothetical protein
MAEIKRNLRYLHVTLGYLRNTIYLYVFVGV